MGSNLLHRNIRLRLTSGAIKFSFLRYPVYVLRIIPALALRLAWSVSLSCFLFSDVSWLEHEKRGSGSGGNHSFSTNA